jgi:hypothetical protein
MSVQSLKQELLNKISGLPEDRLQEALDFVSFLVLQEQRRTDEHQEQEPKLDPSRDPLLQFVGKVSHGSLAQGIDEELYGA